jgi:hypothetical protein
VRVIAVGEAGTCALVLAAGVDVVVAWPRERPQPASASGRAARAIRRRDTATSVAACRDEVVVRPPVRRYHPTVSWFAAVLLACAVVVLVAAEWPLLARSPLGGEARRRRERARRKAGLKVLRSDSDDFAASVERDLANLPTIEEREERR